MPVPLQFHTATFGGVAEKLENKNDKDNIAPTPYTMSPVYFGYAYKEKIEEEEKETGVQSVDETKNTTDSPIQSNDSNDKNDSNGQWPSLDPKPKSKVDSSVSIK